MPDRARWRSLIASVGHVVGTRRDPRHGEAAPGQVSRRLSHRPYRRTNYPLGYADTISAGSEFDPGEPVEAELKTAVVMVGAFNPAIIQRQWLVAQSIVEHAAAEVPEMEVSVTPQATRYRFRTGGLTWTVSSDRVILETEQSWQRIQASAIAMLQCLPHTPVAAIGMNFHKRVPSESWKLPYPRLPEELVRVVGESVGAVIGESHSCQLAESDGSILNLAFRLEEGAVWVDFNFHHSVEAAGPAIAAIERLSDRRSQALALIARFTDGETP